jgi:hypothetical protein
MSSLSEFYYDDWQPRKCQKCHNDKFKSINQDYVANVLCEEDWICAECGQHANFWGYGHWQPIKE